MLKTTQPPQLENPFQPFGEGVRVGIKNHDEGNAILAVNLFDLCTLHNVDFNDAKAIDYPNGSISMLQLHSGDLAHELYLDETSYLIFMDWVAVHPIQAFNLCTIKPKNQGERITHLYLLLDEAVASIEAGEVAEAAAYMKCALDTTDDFQAAIKEVGAKS